MYLDNKYTIWYNNIISNAKSRINQDGYFEKHHIIPVSLGGTNKKDNIVILTPKEHFVCHILLTKMTVGNQKYKMCFALNMLTNAKNIGKGRYTPNSKLYEYAKKSHRKAIDELWTAEKRALQAEKIRPIVKGRKHSIRSIEKMKNKKWSQKAIDNRLQNCLKAAKARKGSKWDEERYKLKFEQYIEKNKHLFSQVFSLADTGMNVRQIALKLQISWDRVNYIIANKYRLNTV